MTVMTERMIGPSPTSDLVCLSHLRWNFVFQRPQHLMTRFADERRVFYVEEPVSGETPEMRVAVCESGVYVVTPQLPAMAAEEQQSLLAELLTQFMRKHRVHSYWLWYYTPMAMPWTRHLDPIGVVY